MIGNASKDFIIKANVVEEYFVAVELYKNKVVLCIEYAHAL